MYDREGFEREFRQICLEEQTSVIPNFALASGFLTGKYRTLSETTTRARSQLLWSYFTPRGVRILDALDRIAADLGATPSFRELAEAAHLHIDESALTALDAASSVSGETPKTARSTI
jgi:aryl-alcohol dehydrogenase-like predicted oxidoreductase